jgi:SagB-type dehydrogenase family enzyme
MATEHDQPPARTHLRSLSEDVLVERSDEHDARVRVVTRWGEFVFDDVTTAVRGALERMSMGPSAVANVEPATAGERATLAEMLDLMSGSVVHTLRLDDNGIGVLLSVVPAAEHARFRVTDVDPDRPLRLSRFAAIRTGRDELVLESAVAPFQVVLHRPLAYRVVISLGRTTSVTELAAVLRVARPVVADLVAYLVAAGVVLPATRDAAPADPTLAQWSHHDLMFHTRTRIGRDPLPAATVPRHGPPPPVTKPVPSGPGFPLYRPDDDLVDSGPSLTSVIEAERVCPNVSDRPLVARQLGELLYRSARIRSVSSSSIYEGVTYETSDRPYLSIAGLYELELYVTVNRCAGLPRGIYHYDPAGHALTLVNDTEPDLAALLDNAKVAARRGERPSALITVTARADRLLWLVSGAGYAMTLMHLGALQQTLNLVATSAGLAACPLVLDSTDTTDRALRLDWPAEVSIGECIIGHRQQ